MCSLALMERALVVVWRAVFVLFADFLQGGVLVFLRAEVFARVVAFFLRAAVAVVFLRVVFFFFDAVFFRAAEEVFLVAALRLWFFFLLAEPAALVALAGVFFFVVLLVRLIVAVLLRASSMQIDPNREPVCSARAGLPSPLPTTVRASHNARIGGPIGSGSHNRNFSSLVWKNGSIGASD